MTHGIETAAWFLPADLPGMPALRQELKDDPAWQVALGITPDSAVSGEDVSTQEAAMSDTGPAEAPVDDETTDGIGIGDVVTLADGITTGTVTDVLTEGDPVGDAVGDDITPSPEDPVLVVAVDGFDDPLYTLSSTVTVAEDAEAEIEGDPEDTPLMLADDQSVDTSFGVADDGAWEGCLIVEGLPSGDGRQIQPNALDFRVLPLPLMCMFRNPAGGTGHAEAELAGSIEWAERRPGPTEGTFEIWGGGKLDLGGKAGTEAHRLISGGFLRGVSADLDDVEISFENPEPSMDAPLDEMLSWDPGLMLVSAGRLMGSTLTSFPAFQEAYVYLLDGDPAATEVADPTAAAEAVVASAFQALVASLGTAQKGTQARTWLPLNQTVTALVAAAGPAPVAPPTAWFDLPSSLGAVYPMRVEPDGRIHGFAATWDSCHIAFRDRCQPPPRSPSGYRHFHTGTVLTSEGTVISTGRIYMDTVHPDLRMQASDVQAFYATTGACVADVVIYETQHGIFVAGAARPTATPGQMRALRGSDVSPDWREVSNRLECVGLLAVNASGFITPALVASAGEQGGSPVKPGVARMSMKVGTGQVTALVAAGMVRHQDRADLAVQVSELRAELAEIRAQLLPIRAERARVRTATIVAAVNGSGTSTS